MLMTPPPSNQYTTPSINRQAIQSLSLPGLQKSPFTTPGMTNSLGGNSMQQMHPMQNPNMNMAHLLSKGF